MNREFRKIITRRGTYFVAWHPRDVCMLLETERLSPNELFPGKKDQLHRLIRDLYLLSCQASVSNRSGTNAGEHRILVRYARNLHDFYNFYRNHQT